ncbi:MAG: hypothetical protein P1V51_08690 [Deltaproteobacteria bacterium]|nr:hypothetical protein [Deltaproteobacteria bacterium]
MTHLPPEPESWSIGAVDAFSWERFRRQWGRLLLAALLMGVAMIFIDAALERAALRFFENLQRSPETELPELLYQVVGTGTSLASWIAQGVLQLGFYVMMLELLREGETTLRPLFGQSHKLPKVALQTLALWLVLDLPLTAWHHGLLQLVMSQLPAGALEGGDALAPGAVVALGIGLLLAIVPYAYVAMGFMFAGLELADDDEVGALQAMRNSWRLVHGQRGRAFVFLPLTLLGLLAFCLGVVVTSVFAELAFVALFLTLKDRAKPAGEELAAIPAPASN